MSSITPPRSSRPPNLPESPSVFWQNPDLLERPELADLVRKFQQRFLLNKMDGDAGRRFAAYFQQLAAARPIEVAISEAAAEGEDARTIKYLRLGSQPWPNYHPAPGDAEIKLDPDLPEPHETVAVSMTGEYISLPTFICCRAEYSTLSNIIHSSRRNSINGSESSNPYLLNGTPGIGKTCYGLVLFNELAQQPEPAAAAEAMEEDTGKGSAPSEALPPDPEHKADIDLPSIIWSPWIIYESARWGITVLYNTAARAAKVFQNEGEMIFRKICNAWDQLRFSDEFIAAQPGGVLPPLNDPRCFHIADGFIDIQQSQVETTFPTLFISTPHSGYQKHFQNLSYTDELLYLSPWSRQEVEDAQRLYFSRLCKRANNQLLPSFPNELIFKMFSFVGGCPRFIYSKAISKGCTRPLDNRISRVCSIEESKIQRCFNAESLATIVSQVNKALDMPDSSIIHSIIHIHAIEAEFGIMNYVARWASEEVASRAMKTLISSSIQMRQLIAVCATVPEKWILENFAFEMTVHNQIQLAATVAAGRGGSIPTPFEARQLHPTEPARTLNQDEVRQLFSVTDAREFGSLEELLAWHDPAPASSAHGQLGGTYFVPRQRYVKAVDALKQPDVLIQITSAPSHPIKLSGILSAARVLAVCQDRFDARDPKKLPRDDLPSDKKIKLIFIVHEDNDERYQRPQAYLTQQDTVYRTSTPALQWLQRNVVQYVFKWKKEYSISGLLDSPSSNKRPRTEAEAVQPQSAALQII